jgi:basic amino acid/polyamine antiporter, APA family
VPELASESAPEFARRLTLFDLVLVATGGTIGSGIFRTPGQVAQAVPSLAGILGAWGLGGAVTLAGALTFAELGASMPRAGGLYVWLSEAYGDLVGFLYGWAYFLVVATGAIAALALVFAEYVGALVPMSPRAAIALAVGALLVLAVINIVGVRIAAAVGGALTLAKLLALAAIIALGLVAGTHAPGAGTSALAGPAGPAPGLAAAMIGVLWSYGGWQHASFAAGEAKRPARDVPLGMVVGAAIVTLVYLLANVAYLRLLPLDAVASSPHVASDAVRAGVGSVGGSLVAAAVAVSALGSASVYTMTTPRLYWAMAERGLFFRRVAELHPRWKTPVRAIVLQTAWAIALVLAWGTFEGLVSYVVFVDWIFFALAGAAVFVLRRRRELPQGYRVPGYPVVPLAFVGVSTWFVGSTLRGQPSQAFAGALLLGLGVPVYRAWKRPSAPVPTPVPTHERRPRLVRAAKVAAIVYPLLLLATIGGLRAVGERWWVTTVALYLPRLVFAAPLPLLAIALLWLRLPRWLWTQLPSVLLLVFPLLGFVAPGTRAASATGPSLRVLSYNVNSGLGGVDRIVTEIDHFAPDVVVLEETGHLEAFEPPLRARYATVRLDDQFILATRYPLAALTEPDRLPFDGHARLPRFMRYVLETPLGPVVFYGIHPVSPREDFAALRGKRGFLREVLSGRVLTGVAAPRIQANSELRELQVATFVEAAQRETDPVVIAGDTNLPGLSPVFARHLSGFHDGFAEAGWGLGYTYPNDRTPWMRIDRILTNDRLRVTRFQVGDSSASDHRCIVADVSR